MQHIGDPLTAPQAGVGAGFCHRQIGIGGRSGHPLLVEEGGDVPAAHAGEGQGEDPPHDRGHFLINDNLVFLCWVHLIAIHWLSADKLSLPLLIPLDALDLLGDVLGVHIVHDGTKWGDVVGGRVHAGVDAVQQGNVPHPVFGEVPLHVVAGHDIITPQTREVFGDDHIDLLRLNVGDHPLETGTVKACAAPAVIS